MIESGRTVMAVKQLIKWYNEESRYADKDWEWGVHEESLETLLDKTTAIPFREFMIRYLLHLHARELRIYISALNPDQQTDNSTDEEWCREIADTVIKAAHRVDQITFEEENGSVCGEKKPQDVGIEILKKLTELIFNDFISNDCYRTGKKGEKRVLGGKDKKGTVSWDRKELLKKITAKSLTKNELCAFAFGLNMDFESFEFFLKKALLLPGFNLWNPDDFILYITFKYVREGRRRFYDELKNLYREIEKKRKGDASKKKSRPAWLDPKSVSTKTIASQAENLIIKIESEEFVFSNSSLKNSRDKIAGFLEEYYELAAVPGSYTRTAVKEAGALLEECMENLAEDISGAVSIINEPVRAEVGNVPDEDIMQGTVWIYYRMRDGLTIPRGTRFFKIENGKKIGFVTEEDTIVEPRPNETWIEVEIPLISKDAEPRAEKKEEQGIFIPKNSGFFCENPDLSGMSNKSGFKTQGMKSSDGNTPAKNIPVGQVIRTGGKISALCKEGAEIPQGTEFWVVKEVREEDGSTSEKKVLFLSTKPVCAECRKDIYVHGEAPKQGAVKGEITDCSIPDWQRKFIRIQNEKIGEKQKKKGEGNKEVIFCAYLYPMQTEDYDCKDVLPDKYLSAVESVLKGTKLSKSKISNIKNGKEAGITRSDLITLSFLAYMSRIEKMHSEDRNKHGNWLKKPGSKKQKAPSLSRYSGFIAETNSLLSRCGFYELYHPNPYDALIIFLISGNEAINAFRNLWGWYLAKKKTE